MTDAKVCAEGGAAGGRRERGERVFEGRDLRPVDRWLAETTAGTELSIGCRIDEDLAESYLDTDDGRLLRLGFCLCIAEHGSLAAATLEPIAFGAGSGQGWYESLTLGRGLSLEEEDSLFGSRLRCLKGERPLRRRIEVRSQRQSIEIRSASGAECELALEQMCVSLVGADEQRGVARLTLRAQPAEDPNAMRLVEELAVTCPLQPSTMTRFEAAMTALGLGSPGPPELGPDRVEASQTVAEAAYAVLRRHFRSMLAQEAGTRLGEDAEPLHDMRVAIRRQRAALRLFRESLPPRVIRLRPRLRRIASVLGQVRDLDVHLATLEECKKDLESQEHVALEVLCERLVRSRELARRKMLRTLDGPRCLQLFQSMTRLLSSGPARRFAPGRSPICLQAPELIRKRYGQVMTLARKIDARSTVTDFHRLRIRCKALRYALEFHSDLYGKSAQRMIRSLAVLQELLGEHQDVNVAARWLRGLIEQRRARLGAPAAFVAGRLAERYERRARRLRRKFPERLKPLTGRSWSRLQETMQRKAVAAAVTSLHGRPNRKASS
jgi:triphosphatase